MKAVVVALDTDWIIEDMEFTVRLVPAFGVRAGGFSVWAKNIFSTIYCFAMDQMWLDDRSKDVLEESNISL